MLKEENINRIKLKIVASLILISMFIQTLSPLSNISNAANTENLAPMDQYLVMVVDNSEDAQYDYEDYGIAHISLVLRGNLNFSGFDVAFKYDSSVMQPTYNAGTKRKPNYQVATTMDDWDPTISAWGSSISENNTWLFASENKFRIEGTTAVDKNPSILGEDVVIADMYFLLEDGYDLTNIPSTVLVPQAGNGLETGIALVYDTYYLLTNVGYYGTDGTAQAEKEVDTISVKNNPTKTTYEHGDTIDLTGGVITVNYTDGTSEDIDMTDPKVGITTGNTADVNTSEVGISYDGKQTSFKITVTDPVDTLVVDTPMTKTEYSHGENIDFSGLKLKATKRSGATEILTSSSSDLSISESTADINSSKFTAFPDDGTGITKGTQKLTFSYKGKSVDGTIVVNDTIDSIQLTNQPTKTIYKYGESLNLAGAEVKVNFGSGNTNTISLPDGNVTISACSNTTTGVKQNLTVTYGGKTASNTIDVEFYNYIDSASIVPPTKVEYEYNTEIDLTGASMQLVWKNSNVTSVDITTAMISGYNKTLEGKQTITVTYNVEYVLSDGNKIPDTITKTFKVDVVNNISKIDITAPTTSKYNHGDSLNLAGGEIKLTYADGTTGTEPITSATITEADGSTLNMSPNASEYGSDHTLSKTLKIEYTKDGVTGTANYPITIVNDVKSIAIHTTPTKVTYNVNEILDVTGGEIEITRATGTPEIIPMTSSMVTNFDSTKENTALKLNVEYTENGVTKTTDYTVSVKDSVKKITLKTTPKTDYKYNDEIDVSTGVITVESGSGTKDIPVTDSMITGYDKTQLGEQEITITYGGQTVTYKVIVKDYVTGISVNPASITGKYNDELSTLINDNNITYTVTYAKGGAQSPAALTESMVAGYSKTKTSKQSLTVTYKDQDTNSYTNEQSFTATLDVTLIDEVSSISIKTQPKTEYKYNEPLDVSGGVITIVRTSGPEDIKITPDMVTGYNPKQLGEQELTLTYGGQTVKYKVTVKDYVKGIILIPPTKVKYEYGESLDLTGGSVQKVMASGISTPQVSLTDSSVTLSTFNPTQEGAQTIRVTYEGMNESFGVIVEDNIQTISIKNLPKTEYKYGESIELTGGKIQVTRSSGKTTDVNITASMISGYNPNKLGKQTITVSYKDKKTTYEVNVKDYIKDISIVKPNKLVYKLNENINLTGGTVKVVMASGAATSPVAMTSADVQIQGFDSSSEGAKLIKVTYKGFTKTFGITVVDELSNMVIKTLPNKLDYRYGESLDVTGGTIEIIKESGVSQVINMNKSMVTGYNPKKLGNQTLTVTYEGFKQQFIVNVEDYVSKLSVKAPTKVTYEYGENIDLTGAKVSIIMASGKVEETTEMTASMITGYDKTKEGKQTIKVEYKGLQGSFQVSVEDKVKGISLSSEPNKVNYKYGESLDVTGATITVIKSSGIYNIPVTSNMVSGYNPKESGIQVITVTYKGFTTKFMVTVAEPEVVEEPEVVKPSKGETTKTNASTSTVSKTSTNIETNTEEQIPEQTTEQAPEEKTETPTKDENTKEPKQDKQDEKPTETLGVKDEKEEPVQNDKKVAGIISLAGILLLFILVFFRRNVKIYVEEDGELVLGGVDKITKKNPKLNIDKYLDGETYPNKVKIRLSDSISEKLDGKEIEIKHRGKTIKHTVHYNDEPYEIMLE